jgi:hypothetical protein
MPQFRISRIGSKEIALVLAQLLIEPIWAQQASSAVVDASDQGWPRVVKADGHQLLYYQPQADEWVDSKSVKGRLAFELTPRGQKAPFFGAATIEANTQTDMTARTVYVYNIHLGTVVFSVPEGTEKEPLIAMAKDVFPKDAVTISLDRLTASLDVVKHKARETAVSVDPPRIVYSSKPAVLVITDGKVVLTDIEKSGVQYVINTNWDLLFDAAGKQYYLLDKDVWLSAKELTGPWTQAMKLPDSFGSIPKTENWVEVRKNLPPKSISIPTVPTVFTSEAPAELILTAGDPVLLRIEGTGLTYVSNTESDVFRSPADNSYYFLTSGRWFRAESLNGPWTAASGKLPADFAKIAPEHARGRVLTSVPGTPQAEQAILEAGIPETATIARGAAKATAEYVGGNPEWEPIQEASISYAKNSQQDVFKIGDLYYLCFQGAWFVSKAATGPWEVSDKVPAEIAQIPASSAKHNVTYVNVYSSTPTTVTYGYTAGYTGMYVAYGAVMWGTGYHYPPYWGYGYYPYPVYWPPYHHTYGYAAWYNPVTGGYGRRGVVYGPYGGYARSSYYNPHTGAYARGGSAWGPGGYAWGGAGYNPRTGNAGMAGGYYDAWSGNYGAGYRGGNQYSRWGEGIAGNGDDWVHAKYRAEKGRGAVIGAETSAGGKAIAGVGAGGNSGVIAKDQNNNIYAGKDGNVYKRDQNGDWHQNQNGSWNAVPPDQVASARNEVKQQASASARPATQQKGAAPWNGTTSARPTASTRQSTPAATTRPASASGQRPSGGYAATRPDTVRGLEKDSWARQEGARRTNQFQSMQRSQGAARSGGRGGGGRRR